MDCNPYLNMPHEDLIALQQMCHTACFGQYDATEIPVSDACGKIYTNVVAALLASSYENFGFAEVQKWLDWLKVDSSRDEWKFTVKFIRSDPRFEHWSEYTKYRHVAMVMKPFELTTDQIKAIIAEVGNETT